MNEKSLKVINELIENGFKLLVWDDRYGKGTWVALSKQELNLQMIFDISESGDLDAIPLYNFLFGDKPSWIPIVISNSLEIGLQDLEIKLSVLPLDDRNKRSTWENSVQEVFNHLNEASKEKYFENHLKRISPTYENAFCLDQSLLEQYKNTSWG